jgi:hypothetical protein
MKNSYSKNLTLSLILLIISTSINAQKLTNYTTSDGLVDGIIYSIVEDQNNDFWFGTWSNEEGVSGLAKFDGTNWEQLTTADGTVSDKVRKIFEDSNNNLWIGSLLSGLSKFDGESWTTYTTADGLVNNSVTSIIEDTSGNLWFSTDGGVSKFDGTTWTSYTTTDGLVSNNVSTVIQDSAGNFWFGTFNAGVSKFDGVSTWTSYTTDDGLASNDVYAMIQDSNNAFWFTNYSNAGLSRFDGSTWSVFTSENDGILENRHRAIFEDNAGNLWFGGNAGINMFNGEQLFSYTTDDGLAHNFIREITQDSEGRMWFGTFGGASVLDFNLVPQVERDALIALYNSADGANWNNNTNWNTTEPVSTWHGVTVVDGHVTRINKTWSNLTGTLPLELQNLTHLESLRIFRNNLSGAIPDLTGLTALGELNINYNYFQFGDFENEFHSYNTNIEFFNPSIMNNVESEIDIDLVVGDTYVMTMPAINGTGVTYQWYKNNEPILDETGLIFTITNAQEGAGGNYTCKASSSIITDLVIEREPINIYREILASDRDALIALYISTDGANWNNNTNWNTAAPVYEWFGVTVSDNQVIEIDLAFNNLVGVLPTQIGDLTKLEKLRLRENQITGTIPVEIGNCTSLTDLNLWVNNLTGNIPSELGNCTNLELLSLEDNQLTGNIPESFDNLTAMGSFWLNGNQLSGDVPDIFSNWSDLYFFSIGDINGSGSYNNFTGTLDLSNNPALNGLWVDNSNISSLNIKNGNNVNLTRFNVNNTPNLSCITADGVDITDISQVMIDSGKTFSEGCGDFVYVNDNNQTGDVYTTAIGNNANLGTKHAPVATITHALSIANEGSIIYVDSGAFAEQVIIDKGITIIGAGQDLTSFVPPTTTLVPAPGPFTEIGLFETIQGIGDVHISNLSINSSNNASQNIIIQSGGSVKNCKLLNGQQGIFFRIESDIKTAVIENNYIEPTGIGINCQGSGLTVNILNNTITRASGYFSGIFAGLDFGPLPQLTVTNNALNNYFGTGMLINSDNGTYNNNSIVGTGTYAIQQFSGNPSNATCNWYGVTDAASVAAKMDGDINYEPWLVDGTDDDPGLGFQPLPGACNGTNPVITLDDAIAIDCFGSNNGTINISVTDGLAPFTFVWTKDGDPGFNAATEDQTGLAPGSYNLLLTDANGSTASLNNVNITEPPFLTASIINNSTACSNNATVTAGGGTTGYTYLWSNGDITDTIDNVPVGTYDVTVTDANGCTAISSIDLTVGEAFNPSASVTDVRCFGDSNGIIEVTNANGTAPFEFSKDGIIFSDPQETFPYIFNNLEAGTYEIAVRDGNGCTGFITKTISQPEELTVTLVSIEGTCSGESTGSISVATNGGTGGLSYSWEGPESYTFSQRNISGLAVGEYTLTVTDNNDCTALLDVVVPTSNEIVVEAEVINVLCIGTLTGSIDLTVSGGSGSGFTYSWTGNITSTSEDISNLGSGTNYNVTITDIGTGCAVSESYIITQPAANLSLATSRTNATGCEGGTITATASGGTSSYMYKLDDGDFQSSGDFTLLSSGSYTVWVQDASGCTTSKVVAITDNGKDEWENNNSKNKAKLIFIGTPINARIALANDTADWFMFDTPSEDGNYTVNLHPSASFNVQLYPDSRNAAALAPISPTSNQYALIGSATYFVQITGGLSFDCYDLSISPLASGARSASSKTEVTTIKELFVRAYPNPHQGVFNLAIKSPGDGTARIELFNILGQLLATRDVSIEKGRNNIVEFNDVTGGMILYHITFGNQRVNGKIIGKD